MKGKNNPKTTKPPPSTPFLKETAARVALAKKKNIIQVWFPQNGANAPYNKDLTKALVG